MLRLRTVRKHSRYVPEANPIEGMRDLTRTRSARLPGSPDSPSPGSPPSPPDYFFGLNVCVKVFHASLRSSLSQSAALAVYIIP